MKPQSAPISIVRGTGIVGALTLLSRMLGLVRDLVVAHLFGAGFFTDVFFVAFRIPNLLRSLVAEGALTSAFVPVFAEELKREPAQAQRALSAATTLLLGATVTLALMGIIFAPEIVALTAPGFGIDTGKANLCITLTRIMLPYVIFVSLVALLNGALNTVGVFGAAPLAQIAMNFVLILGALVAELLDDRSAVILLAASVIAGGIAEIAVQIPGLRKARLSLIPARHGLTPATRQMLRLMLPAILGAAIYQLAVFISTLLASVLRPGSVSWLFYADRIAQLPVGVFTVALASVLLPALSSAAAESNHGSFGRTLINSLRYTSFIIIPVSAGLFFYAEPLTRLLFERGAFDSSSTISTALAVQAMSIGLWGVSCTSMAMRAFIARKDTLTPALVGTLGLVLGVLISLTMMGPPEAESQSSIFAFVVYLQTAFASHFFTMDLGHVGLALSTGIAQLGSFLILVLLIKCRGFQADWGPFIRATWQALIAAGLMLMALSLCDPLCELDLLKLALGIPIGAGVFCGACLCLKSAELNESLKRFQGVIMRKGGSPSS